MRVITKTYAIHGDELVRVAAMACVFVHVTSMACLYSGSGAQESKYSWHDCREFHGCLPFSVFRRATAARLKCAPFSRPSIPSNLASSCNGGLLCVSSPPPLAR